MVMVFDQFGEQMPEYQGPIEEVEEKIKAVYDGPWIQGDYPAGKIWHKLDKQRTNGPEIDKIVVDEVRSDVDWEKILKERREND